MRIAKKLLIAALIVGGFTLFAVDFGPHWNTPYTALGFFLIAAGWLMATEWF